MINVGDMVVNRYRLERQIGEGGMASVWLASDTTLLRHVAIKFVWQRDVRRTQALIDSFLREARLAASVVHRNVVQVLDFGVLPDSTPFMVMEALEGETLGDMFNAGAQFTLDEVVELGARSLDGLIAVHEAGIVHRDIKPENIFLLKSQAGFFPKLLDFGISRSLDPGNGRRSAVTTRDGRIVGTPEYMSPEQAGGVGAVDRRTDIYSMGVILYETIAGDVPYKSDHMGELLMRITRGDARPIVELVPAVGQAISDVIQRAMHPDPQQRFTDAAEMSEAWAAATKNALATKTTDDTVFPERDMAERRRRTRTSGEQQQDPFTQTLELTTGASNAESLEAWKPSDREQPTIVIKERVAPPFLVWSAGAALLVAMGAVLVMVAQVKPVFPPGNKFIVVQGAAGGDPGPATGGAATAGETGEADRPAPTDPAPANAAQAAAVKKRKREPAEPPKAPAKRTPRRPASSAEAAVARDFTRQKAPVVRCFEAFSEERLPRMAVRITIDESGRVTESTVTPAEYDQSTVGDCVRTAVRAMRFAPRADKAAYRVPLIARRGP